MIHLQIAEAGKRHSLKGDHPAALERYRHALRLAVQQRTNPVFLYHYTECILDGLEAGGQPAQALALTDRALEERVKDDRDLGRRVRASLLERRVVLLFVLGREAEADAALAEAAPLGGPILTALQDARRRRLAITLDWLAGLRRRLTRGAVNAGALRQTDAKAGEVHFMNMKESAGD